MIFGLTAAIAISSAISPLAPCEPIKLSVGERILAGFALVFPLAVVLAFGASLAAMVYFLVIDRL